jgi:hypothetical protein
MTYVILPTGSADKEKCDKKGKNYSINLQNEAFKKALCLRPIKTALF